MSEVKPQSFDQLSAEELQKMLAERLGKVNDGPKTLDREDNLYLDNYLLRKENEELKRAQAAVAVNAAHRDLMGHLATKYSIDTAKFKINIDVAAHKFTLTPITPNVGTNN